MTISVSGSQITFNDASTQNTAATGFGYKNRLINGNFDIWQYGTSSSSSGYTTADRWKLQVAGTATFSQETSVIPTGSRYALKWTTGAASSYGQIRQFIEYANLYPLLNKTIICSAQVRCNSTFTGNAQFEVGYATTSDSSSATYTTISGAITGTVNSSGYTQITWIGTVPSNAAGLYIGIVPTVVQASGAVLYMGQIQCEIGSTATSFDYRPYGTELALCQRYYWRYTGGGYTGIGVGSANNATSANVSVKYPVTMRTSPTITGSNLSINNPSGNFAITALSGAYAGYDTAFIPITTASGMTANQAVTFTLNAAGTGYLEATAEL